MLSTFQNEITLFAETNFRNQCRRFGIKRDDRRRHMYLVGKTGMGKSTALENLIISDIRAGEGVAIVDPHGDLVEKIIDYIPSNRVNDVVYFNPSDVDYPIAFNVVESVDQAHQHLVASGLIGVFKKIWADSWGPRLEYVLRNSILALLDYPGSTLLGVMRILVDKAYRKKVIEKIKDPVVKSFWVEEYSKYPDKFQTEAIAPIQNKVGQFLSNSLIRNIVGQVKSAIDLRDIMDHQKILLMNLAKGRIGEDTSALLGAMMITKLQMAAMERIDLPEKERKDFYLYVDEFQNFATQSFANILSEARKYHLNLIIAHQYIEQLEPDFVRPAVFGNVGTVVVFRIGGADAEFLETEFAPRFTPEDLVNIPKYNAYMKLMIDGVSSDPFSARILPPLRREEQTGNREKIIRVSRERCAKPRGVIEEKIARWSGVMSNEEEEERQSPIRKKEEPPLLPKQPEALKEFPITPQSPVLSSISPERQSSDRQTPRPFEGQRKNPPLKPSGGGQALSRKEEKKKAPSIQHEITCARCGVKDTISFIPDGRRPVYCKPCLKIMKGVREPQKETSRPLSKPTISLQEAVQQKPVSFSSGQGQKKQQEQAKQKEERSQVPQTKNAAEHPTPVKTLKPGEVIQFS